MQKNFKYLYKVQNFETWLSIKELIMLLGGYHLTGTIIALWHRRNTCRFRIDINPSQIQKIDWNFLGAKTKSCFTAREFRAWIEICENSVKNAVKNGLESNFRSLTRNWNDFLLLFFVGWDCERRWTVFLFFIFFNNYFM